ncbi:CXXC-type zinc finger protein 1 isoform X2 [Folsomia candida]|uniref:CXXC-type zinc finger protein 1 isoform X2 n=1 Tax=Folsomia candida TaxID=158441 RepID=UPI000B8F72A9|nr:CXXC-type zinc finger protein 1 isoform X2 [Folsomia candida]
MASKDISKKDIAKQFDLPERKSKIATLLKETDVYCICRSSDSTRFMIACDNCEEWFHGDCINITESDAKVIKHYYCPGCIADTPSLEIEYKKPKQPSVPSSSKRRKSSDGKKEKVLGKKNALSSSKKSGQRKPKRLQSSGSENDDDRDYKVLTQQRQNRDRHSPNLWASSEEDAPPPPSEKRTAKKQEKRRKEKSKEKARRKTRIRRQTTSSESEKYYSDEFNDDEDDEKQCFGLDCTNAARKNSKYCSQECCIKLATERIYRILPGRIQEWNLTQSVAEEHNRKELEEIRTKQIEAKIKISELERKRADLDRHVHNVQQLVVDPDAEDEEPEEEGIIHCITCGHEIPIRSCIKHMERCYNKYESQTSFGSIYKTKLEGTPIFCDFYNPSNGTYCKRLAVLCPEHSKEPKIRDSEVCGCPVVVDLTENMEKFCRLPKKKCNRHFCWEKLRRAELDMERVRNWLKLDELLEQERQIRLAMSNRGGVMGLLLHSTFDHDLRNRIQTQMQEGTLQQEKASADLGEDISEDEEDDHENARESSCENVTD